MTTRSCGCTSGTCGCCEGVRRWTPQPVDNRPGLPALDYRVGTHGAFLQTMEARLAGMEVQAPGADGQTMETFYPLRGLTTRQADDPATALLDGWATVGDVLTFYQERIANEGYLRTATERRSVLELARLVGYELRPGVAATVFLAYTLDDNQLEPVEIPAGARSQSIPGPDELPQAFETSEALVARPVWNNLLARRSRPQEITLANALTISKVFVGPDPNLKSGDLLLLVFGEDGDPAVMRTVASLQGQPAGDSSVLTLQPVDLAVGLAVTLLAVFVTQGMATVPKPSGPEGRVIGEAEEILTENRLGFYSAPTGWVERISGMADGQIGPDLEGLLEFFAEALERLLDTLPPPSSGPVVTDPSVFVSALLKEPIPQPANALRLDRSVSAAFARGSDVTSQLLVGFAPRLKDTYYVAWSNANVNSAPAALKEVLVLSGHQSLFGAGVSKQVTYFTSTDSSSDPHLPGQPRPPSQWQEWTLEDERPDELFLEQPNDAILAGSYVMIQNKRFGKPARVVRRVIASLATQRFAYGTSAKTTQLTLNDDWWQAAKDDMPTLRSTLVHAPSQALTLVEEPMPPTVSGSEIELDRLHDELMAGRWLVLSGERADIDGVDGVTVSELLMISGVEHGYDPSLPSDKTHTTLRVATPTAYVYKLATLRIYGNVVKATHGESRQETLGSGDGSLAMQSFAIRQPPLTFVPAPAPRGVESTLKVYVNDVEWHETDTLAGAGARDRSFVTKTHESAGTTMTFGNGAQGSRLPTGVENIQARYRSGIGRPGNVRAEQISILQSRPLGVKGVINPLRSSGGADRENRDQGRENVPFTTRTMDRLVSVRDYEDFTRTFAGIAKADARRLSDRQRLVTHLTVAGIDDIPIDPVSDLYRNLVLALRTFGDPDVAIQVEMRELVALVLSVKVKLQADYTWEPVATAIRSTLLDVFGFQRRALGQPAQLCEVIGELQRVEGVAWVDVDIFGGLPEKRALPDGTRRLLTADELAQAAQALTGSLPTTTTTPATTPYTGAGRPAPLVDVNIAKLENGRLRPAQLAILTAAVPDTLILKQIA